MAAGRYDLSVEKGAKLERTFRVRDESTGEVQNFTGYGGRFTVRTPKVDGEVLWDFEIGDSGGELSVNDAGELDLAVSAIATGEVDDGCLGWFTLKVWPDGEPQNAERIVEGPVRFKPESSRDDVQA